MLPERVENKIYRDPNCGCWIWIGSLSNNRFGTIKYEGKTWKASRLVFTLLKNEIAEGKYLLHSCDNELCVNPHHLREGTQKENMEDMYKRGRSNHSSPSKGSCHCNSKITEEDVKEIRMSRVSQTCTARKYGISQQTVSEIVTRKIWKHVI